MKIKNLEAIALSIRSLTIDAVEKAQSGHPGMPMGCAELGAYIYGELLKINPKDPAWINRDRFVLSAGHGSMFLYSLLYLAGYSISLDDIKNFRQLNSKTPGHPEFKHTPGVETTTGPLGAGFSNAVGMAIAETMLARRFNTEQDEIIDHYTYVIAGDGCLMEGISSEAASLAGHLKLNKLIVFYDSNKISIEGSTDLTFTEQTLERFNAYGWQTLQGSAHDLDEIHALVQAAQKESSRPTLIQLNSVIARGSPHKSGSHTAHGAPLGAEEVRATKKNLGIPENQSFFVKPEAREHFKAKQKEWQNHYQNWQTRFNQWAAKNPRLKQDWDLYFNSSFDFNSLTAALAYTTGDKVATRKAGGDFLDQAVPQYPPLIGGSADLAPSNNTLPRGADSYSAQNRQGQIFHFGVREHAMGGICNGLALYGGLKVFCATFLVFSDYMRPAIRLASLMKLPLIYVFTHDSVFVGEDGPTHQPIEHLAALRAIPGLNVVRPGDAQETVMAWKTALSEQDQPTALILSRQGLAVYAKEDPDWSQDFEKGAYVVNDPEGSEAVIVASGSEVSLALKAVEQCSQKVRVVSMPCLDRFLKQDQAFKDKILPPGLKTIVVEAGIKQGWEGIASSPAHIVSIDCFGISGPGAQVAGELGLNTESILKALEH